MANRDDKAPLRAINDEISDSLSAILPRTVGFALLTFTYGADGECAYTANGDAQDMILLFRNLADRLEAEEQENQTGQDGERFDA